MEFFLLNNKFIIEKGYNFIGFYPEMLLIILILFYITYLVICDHFSKYKLILTNIIATLSILSLILVSLLILNNLNINFIIFQSLIIQDTFSNNIKLILLFFSIIFFFLSIDYVKKELLISYEYFLIILLALLGLIMLISSYDLISMYLAIELQSLCLYILATLKQYSNFSTEAGIKYFILGAFSSGILLFGCTILYGFTGVTDFYNLEILFQNNLLDYNLLNNVFIGILFILIGLLFKMAAAPFHMWSPDVYEGSPTIVTAFFAIIPKLALLALILRFSFKFLNQNLFYLNYFLFFCTFLSLVIGTLGAIYQVKIKRLLAYSAVSHVGFLLLGLSVMTIESFYNILFYICIYMLLSTSIFSILLSIRRWNNNWKIKKINEIVLITKSNFLLATIFALVLFSIAGIPPLIGFYSKLYIFMVGIQNKYYIITIIAALVSVASALYYIRLIKLMFFKQLSYRLLLQNVSYMNSLIISFTLLFNFFFLFSPNIIMLFLHNLILNLFI